MRVTTCDSFFGLLFAGLSILTLAQETSKPKAKRYGAKSFPKHNIILGRNVTCGDIPENKVGRFIAPTWSCHDIRVNGARIAYGYYPGMGVDSKCNETGGKHEFAQLCRELLKKVDSDHPLHALYVPDAYCAHMAEWRVLLNRTSEFGFDWIDKEPGNGWVKTIQCMVKLQEKF